MVTYIPAISGDKIINSLLKCPSEQFYSINKNIDFNFLISAGRHYDNMSIRKDLNMGSNCFIIGDSGGFQIANKTLTYSVNIEQDILKWQKNNCDLGIYLDIPLKNSNESFVDILNKNLKIFSYYSEKATKPMLNVLHGRNFKEYNEWYNATKCFNYCGWAIADTNTLYDVLLTYSILLQNNELDKIKYIHYLGIHDLKTVLILDIISRKHPTITFMIDNSLSTIMAEQNYSIVGMRDYKLKYADLELKTDEDYINTVFYNIFYYSTCIELLYDSNKIITEIYEKIVDNIISDKNNAINECEKFKDKLKIEKY